MSKTKQVPTQALYRLIPLLELLPDGPCEPGLNWLRKRNATTAREAWNDCPSADYLLWAAYASVLRTTGVDRSRPVVSAATRVLRGLRKILDLGAKGCSSLGQQESEARMWQRFLARNPQITPAVIREHIAYEDVEILLVAIGECAGRLFPV